jgi:hypothetical protein
MPPRFGALRAGSRHLWHYWIPGVRRQIEPVLASFMAARPFAHATDTPRKRHRSPEGYQGLRSPPLPKGRVGRIGGRRCGSLRWCGGYVVVAAAPAEFGLWRWAPYGQPAAGARPAGPRAVPHGMYKVPGLPWQSDLSAQVRRGVRAGTRQARPPLNPALAPSIGGGCRRPMSLAGRVRLRPSTETEPDYFEGARRE